MACITISVEDALKKRLEFFSWVNWSEVGREELYKRYIFQKYLKTKHLTKEEQLFCDHIDWHPVDELPLNKEFIEEVKKVRKGKHHQFSSIKDLQKMVNKG
jgi:hypothetical protein